MSARPKCECPPDALSPSQIDTFRHCQRKWGFRKIAGQAEPEFGFQVAGKEIHDMLEKYALTGVLPDRNSKYGPAVWQTAKALLPPNPRHVCEQHIRLDIKDNAGNPMTIHGYPDMLPCGAVEVDDYKTVSVRKIPFEFAHTPETLVEDTQAIIYGTFRLLNTDPLSWKWVKDGSTVVLRWIYIERATPFRVKVVKAELSGNQIYSAMHRIWQTAAQMYEVRREAERLEAVRGPMESITGSGFTGSSFLIPYVNNTLQANTDFCSAYGGCPHASICTAAKPRKDDTMVNFNFDEMTKSLAALNGGGANNGGASVAPAPSATNPPPRSAPAAQPQPDPINPPVEHVDATGGGEGEDDEEAAAMREVERIRQAKAERAAAEKAAAKAAKEKEAKEAAEAKSAEAKKKPKPEKTPAVASSHDNTSTLHPGSVKIVVEGYGETLEAAIQCLRKQFETIP